MSGRDESLHVTYVQRSVWHIVQAGPINGPLVGAFYVFKCYRWAPVDALPLQRGRPGNGDVCVRCESALKPSGAGADRLPVDDLEDPGL
jgi:hypothetical protein